MELCNLTALCAERILTADVRGRDLLLIVVKATYDLHRIQDGVPVLADSQIPIQLADEYLADPEVSSLKMASDMAPQKQGADVVMIGHVQAPRPDKQQIEVGFRFGSLIKAARVHADRVWEKKLWGLRPSDPAPFTKVPLIYERSFGGMDPTTGTRLDANPVGCGFVGRKSHLDLRDQRVPNLEHPGKQLSAPCSDGYVVGFGFVAPAWQPRRQYAGTYDAAWERDVSPFLPEDFDPRFFSCAPADQILDKPIRGGEQVQVVTGNGHQPIRFRVPQAAPCVSVLMDSQWQELPVACDTAVLDIDLHVMTLVWRASLNVEGRLDEIHSIRVASTQEAA